MADHQGQLPDRGGFCLYLDEGLLTNRPCCKIKVLILMDSEQRQKILDLRSLKLTPKLIARQLGLKVSAVSAILQEEAEKKAIIQAETGELAPLDKCLMNVTCAEKFFSNNDNDDEALEKSNGSSGFGLVFISRQVKSGMFSVCTYLVDYWCLGVKDTIGPKNMNGNKYVEFIEQVYNYFPYGYQEITLQQAQEFVFGAINYAQALGFSPHRDFAQSRSHLGEWNGDCQLTFGRTGKPCYVSGPYDNARQIMKTLEKNVGIDNFDYIINPETF